MSRKIPGRIVTEMLVISNNPKHKCWYAIRFRDCSLYRINNEPVLFPSIMIAREWLRRRNYLYSKFRTADLVPVRLKIEFTEGKTVPCRDMVFMPYDYVRLKAYNCKTRLNGKKPPRLKYHDFKGNPI